MIVLAACTAISKGVYEASLPRVRTRVVEKEIGELLEGYDGLWGTFAWVPRECIFPGQRVSTVLVYRIRTRQGQFSSTEYYVEAAEIPLLEERENGVLRENLYLNYSESLACQTDLPLIDGQTVIWLNPKQ